MRRFILWLVDEAVVVERWALCAVLLSAGAVALLAADPSESVLAGLVASLTAYMIGQRADLERLDAALFDEGETWQPTDVAADPPASEPAPPLPDLGLRPWDRAA